MKDKLLIDAIAYALSREVVPSDDYYDKMQGIQRRQAVSIAGMAQTEQIKFVMSQVNSALASGQTFEQFQKSVNLVDIDLPRYRLRTIYRTNIQQAYAHGRWTEQQRNKKDKPYLVRDEINDSKTRPHHAGKPINGMTRPIDDPIWQYYYAPDEINCFLPHTTIAGDIECAMIRSYVGKAVELTTQSSKTMRVTSGHPVLTERGWVRADGINIGDNVLSYNHPIDSGDIDSLLGQVDNNQAVPTAKNLFESFFRDAFTSGGTASLKFNSDIINGKININIHDSCLLLDVNSDIFQGFKKISLINRDIAATEKGLVGFGASKTCLVLADIIFNKNAPDIASMSVEFFCQSMLADVGCSVNFDNFSFEFVIPRVGSRPCGRALPLSTTRGLFDGLPLDCFRLGLSSESDALVAEVALNGISADSGLFGHLSETHAREVFSDPVVNISHFDFSDHVYDFQSSESLVSSDSIITHNCRGKMRGLTADEAEARGLTVDSDLPDPAESSGWGTPDQYNERFTNLVNDKVSELMLNYFKQSSTIAKIGGRITSSIGKFLNKTTTKLATLVAAAKKLIEDEGDE